MKYKYRYYPIYYNVHNKKQIIDKFEKTEQKESFIMNNFKNGYELLQKARQLNIEEYRDYLECLNYIIEKENEQI